MSSTVRARHRSLPTVPGRRTAGATAEATDSVEQAPEIDCLREEVAQLHRALKSRPHIDQACGMVMVLASCDAQTAWRVLVEVSQHTNTKLHSVAEELVRATTNDMRVPGELGDVLAKALRRHRGDQK